jgi:ABC-type branched-subunit amino acid transport system permease subunit
MVAFAKAHPSRYAVAAGLVAGVLAFLIGWLARREWIWFLFIMAAVVAAASTYTMTRWHQQDGNRLEQHRQDPD